MEEKFENSKFMHILLYPISFGFSLVVGIRKKFAKKPIGRYSFFFDRYPAVAAMRAGAKMHKGVDAIYTYRHKKGESSILETFWMSARNCQALRNRYRMVRQAIGETIAEHKKNSDENMLILSLAAGTARSVIESAVGKDYVAVVAVDSSDEAIADSKKLAEKFEKIDINWHKKDLLAVDSFLDDEKKAHLVEVVGLFEYLDEDQIEKFLNVVKRNMHNAGSLIVSQIHPNSESSIVEKIVDWPLNHRQKRFCCGSTVQAAKLRPPVLRRVQSGASPRSGASLR